MRDNVLETERLILRRLEISDVDALMGIFPDPEAMRYYPGTKSRGETEEWVRRSRESGFGFWAVVLKGSGEFAGQCGLSLPSPPARAASDLAAP